MQNFKVAFSNLSLQKQFVPQMSLKNLIFNIYNLIFDIHYAFYRRELQIFFTKKHEY